MAALDYFRFGKYTNTPLNAPFRGGAAVTPDDTNELSRIGRAIYVGTGGHLTGVTVDGDTLTFKNLASGSMLSGSFKKILATGTTAADLLNLW